MALRSNHYEIIQVMALKTKLSWKKVQKNAVKRQKLKVTVVNSNEIGSNCLKTSFLAGVTKGIL